VTGSEAGHGPRLYLRDFAGGKPRAVSPEGYLGGLVSPDGKWVTVRGPDRKRYLYPLAGGEPIPLPALEREDVPLQFSADGRFLYVARTSEAPAQVYRMEIATGKKELWKTLMPADAAGVSSINPLPTRDGSAYVYNYTRVLSDLFLVDGLK